MSALSKEKDTNISNDFLETDFFHFKIYLGGEEEVVNWLEKNGGEGGREVAINELRSKSFRYLGTPEGWDFLIKKFPCPNAIRKEH